MLQLEIHINFFCWPSLEIFLEIGLKLREFMLINGLLFNSEVWYGLSEYELSELEKVDEYLLRKLLNAHSKTPKEFLYLETGSLPIRFIIKKRRISYLHHILNRDKKELISKVYFAQKRKSVKDDWANTVKKDCDDINLILNEDSAKNLKKEALKNKLKEKIYFSAFKYLQVLKSSHSKVREVSYEKLCIQPYLTDNNFTTVEKQLLFSLRGRMTNIKNNFSSIYQNLNCDLCDVNLHQTDAHLLDCNAIISSCPELNSSNSVEYEDIFDDISAQLKITKIYKIIFETKEKLEKNLNAQPNKPQCSD